MKHKTPLLPALVLLAALPACALGMDNESIDCDGPIPTATDEAFEDYAFACYAEPAMDPTYDPSKADRPTGSGPTRHPGDHTDVNNPDPTDSCAYCDSHGRYALNFCVEVYPPSADFDVFWTCFTRELSNIRFCKEHNC